jgi:alkylhydroperoxidase/carboxymuconolactone decarboxylase family protein YurZ
MDTNNIKKFATEARLKLRTGIEAKILTLGFDRKGQVQPQLMPQLMQGGTLWNGGIQPEGFYHQWMSLYRHVQQYGVSAVFEEAAYTWFNRLVAIRILQKNGIIAPVLAYADAARTPMIVHEARQGQLPVLENEMQRATLMQLLDDDTKTAEQFALLIVAYCHQCPVIRACFGSMADYTELLLPQNILSEGGFVDMLNHTEFITDEDFHSPELIGWLYQFYNAERKDEAFAKKGKYEADDIAPATQIFTPNWIVKYMVQNTVGRIYLDNNSYAEDMKARWKYLVEPAEPTPAEAVLHYDELTDLRVADLSCGSGHILNECFDMLYDLYIAEGYGRREAIEDIFRYNLTGVDLDTRAKQLATFALMLKACQKDASFADAHCLPRVLDMPAVPDFTRKELQEVCLLFMGGYETVAGEELVNCFDLLRDADTLGSIMLFELDEEVYEMLKYYYGEWRKEANIPEYIQALMPGVELIIALTERYHAVVMNPPYMPTNKSDILSQYVNDHYPDTKPDLFSVFMDVAQDCVVENGKYGMINMQSWMFLSSFEKLRKWWLENQQIDSLLHLGPRTFDELSGEVVQNVAFVFTDHKPIHSGVYYRLVDGGNCTAKEEMFLRGENRYVLANQSQFEQIPGCPIAYWIKYHSLFSNRNLCSEFISGGRNKTHDNTKFVRTFWEISAHSNRWIPYSNGGEYRKYYGNQIDVVDWSEEATSFYEEHGGLLNNKFQNKEGITWNLISSRSTGFRIKISTDIYSSASPTIFNNQYKCDYYVLGLLNTKISRDILYLLNPTINTTTGDVLTIPLIRKNVRVIKQIVKQNISISKQDWDNHETSWDFQSNELVSMTIDTFLENNAILFADTESWIDYDTCEEELNSLECRVNQYEQKWERLFMQLHANEEELNRQFIEIYGLQDELTPDVPLSEVTILQQGEINVSGDGISFNRDVLIKQFISYAIGCMMGRYRLDRPGLAIAHPDATPEEYATYTYGDATFEIDDDAIIPLMPADSGFSDNAAQRFSDFVRIALGDTCHIPNLNFVEKCLGKTVEQYFVKDFWKDHKKMYQNRPIYWLFASRKGAFQVITYMHRMNAYTVERIRAKYLLPYIEHLQQTVARLEARGAQLSTAESRRMEQLRKQLEECREYHERLQVVAEQAIAFDLDDGVVVNHAKFGDVVTKLK